MSEMRHRYYFYSSVGGWGAGCKLLSIFLADSHSGLHLRPVVHKNSYWLQSHVFLSVFQRETTFCELYLLLWIIKTFKKRDLLFSGGIGPKGSKFFPLVEGHMED